MAYGMGAQPTIKYSSNSTLLIESRLSGQLVDALNFLLGKCRACYDLSRMKAVSIFAIISLLTSSVWAQDDVLPTEESLLKKVRQYRKQFVEAESKSFEYFEGLFHLRSAYRDYVKNFGSSDKDGGWELLESELSESDLNTLYEFFNSAVLWERLPTDAELKLMVDRKSITETPSEYKTSHSETLRSTIHSAEEIFVYEGYIRGRGPHDFDFKSYPHENQQFVLPKRQVETDRKPLLRDLFGSDKFFVDWGGAKACDGFSADYMVEWAFEGAPVRIMVCNGCYEIIVTHKGQWFKHDFGRLKSTEIKRSMAKFDQNRTRMREIFATKSAPKEKPGLSDKEKAEIRAALKRER